MLIKTLHISTAIISISLFILRGVWTFTDSPLMRQKWLKILPHANDTVLLIAAITLTVQLQQYPLTHTWLTAKVTALLLYIGLGMLAFRFRQQRTRQLIAWLMALLAFAYIASVAITKNPLIAF